MYIDLLQLARLKRKYYSASLTSSHFLRVLLMMMLMPSGTFPERTFVLCSSTNLTLCLTPMIPTNASGAKPENS